MQYVLLHLWPVSLLGGEGIIHHIFDGEPGHGTLREGNDPIDCFHRGVQLTVGLQREFTADLKREVVRLRDSISFTYCIHLSTVSPTRISGFICD